MADGIIAEPKSVEELVAHGYRIRPMTYLREGWRTFTRYPAGFLGFALLFTVASQGPMVLAHAYGQFLSLVLQVIMMAGIAMVVWKQMRSDPTSFIDFFPDWETVGQLILCTIVGLLLIAGGLLLFVVPGIYLIVAYTFAYMLIIDRGFSVWQALEASRRVVNKNWWKVAGLTGLMVALMAGGTALFSLVLGLAAGRSSQPALSGGQFERPALRFFREQRRSQYGNDGRGGERRHDGTGVGDGAGRMHVRCCIC